MPLDRIRIVLVGTTHAGNIGAAARAMKTMGLTELVLVAPRSFPDAEADARATGAADLLARARVCATVDEALAGAAFVCALSARRRDLAPIERDLRAAATEIVAEAAHGDVAVLFGPERTGLDTAAVSRCHRLVRIDTDPAFGSLNLAAAVQVVAYELRGAAHGVPAPEEGARPAPHEDVDGLVRHLEQTMIATGFLAPEQPGRLVQRMRRLMARARPEPEEVAILRGFLRSVTEGARAKWRGPAGTAG